MLLPILDVRCVGGGGGVLGDLLPVDGAHGAALHQRPLLTPHLVQPEKYLLFQKSCSVFASNVSYYQLIFLYKEILVFRLLGWVDLDLESSPASGRILYLLYRATPLVG